MRRSSLLLVCLLVLSACSSSDSELTNEPPNDTGESIAFADGIETEPYFYESSVIHAGGGHHSWEIEIPTNWRPITNTSLSGTTPDHSDWYYTGDPGPDFSVNTRSTSVARNVGISQQQWLEEIAENRRAFIERAGFEAEIEMGRTLSGEHHQFWIVTLRAPEIGSFIEVFTTRAGDEGLFVSWTGSAEEYELHRDEVLTAVHSIKWSVDDN